MGTHSGRDVASEKPIVYSVLVVCHTCRVQPLTPQTLINVLQLAVLERLDPSPMMVRMMNMREKRDTYAQSFS